MTMSSSPSSIQTNVFGSVSVNCLARPSRPPRSVAHDRRFSTTTSPVSMSIGPLTPSVVNVARPATIAMNFSGDDRSKRVVQAPSTPNPPEITLCTSTSRSTSES
jgi:hypothetical protein